MYIQNILGRLKFIATSSFSSFTRSAALIGITLAVIGPFVLFTMGGREANRLPWYVWLIISMLLLTVVGVGFLAFKRQSHDAEDISISPDRKS
jgi:hypothetical protein